jgi:hypothetical protein
MSTLRLSPIVGIMVLIIGSEVRSADEPLDFQKEIARCAALEGSLERLSCYDELADNVGLDRPQPIATPTEGAGK